MPESWWLKIKRAQHHMVEIERCLLTYQNSHPYDVVPIRQPNHRQNLAHRLVMRQPDPALAIILGEFIHSLRSALDHIVVACSTPQERKSAAFPVAYIDPRAVDDRGAFINPDAEQREAFERQIKGLTVQAQAIVIRSQPYTSSDPDRAGIGIINRLENADKHRQLIVVGHGLRDPRITLRVRGIDFESPTRIAAHSFLEDGARLEPEITTPPGLEVEMQLSGTPVVTVKVSRLGGNQRPIDIPVRTFMVYALWAFRPFLREMEPFIRSD
ncbi:MAG TPA: hypothetical protein VI759_06905 [Dehalococcoidia bacterium]|nr:hypothetical protein [Dehalococcoidia bacterium]